MCSLTDRLLTRILLLPAGCTLPLAASLRAQSEFSRYLTVDSALVQAGGDVNGDGFSDAVTLWYGQATIRGGPAGSVLYQWTPSSPSVAGFLGLGGVVATSDLNQDGKEDVLLEYYANVGVEVRSGADGSVMGILYPPPLAGTPTYFGQLSPAGDLDGDGFPDVLLRFGGNCWGGVMVVSGSSLQPLYTLGPFCGGFFGTALGGLEDVNGDGIRDFFVTEPEALLGGLYAGRLRVYSGPTGALLGELAGTVNGQELGWSATGLGDLDGDGIPEIAFEEYPAGIAYGPPQVRVVSANSFATLYTIPLARAPQRLLDADGDGVDEILVWGSDVNRVHSGATGTQLESVPAKMPGSPLFDFNGDGLGDFGTNDYPYPWTLPILVQAQNLAWGYTTPATGSEVTVYVARNLQVVGPTPVGGTAQLSIRAPKHPGKAFQVVLSLEGTYPGIPLGSFLLPLVPDGLFINTFTAGLVGVLNGTGNGSIAVPIPAVNSLQGLEIKASGWVIDPGATPLPIACVLTGAALTLQ